MTKRKISRLILPFIILPLCACGPSQAKLDSQTTPAADTNLTAQATETLTPIPATETATPIPAKFINPPEFLEKKFKVSSGWKWMEAVEGRKSAFQESKHYNTTFYLVYENNMIGVGEIGGFSDVFINFVLEQFISASTRSEIIEFKNGYSEPGIYQTIIDGFIIELDIVESKNDYLIYIYETE